MTRDTALKYFGDEDPIGKSLTTPREFLVAGVVENVPKNSHLEFNFLLPMGNQNQPNYVSFSALTYVKLSSGASPSDIESKMPALVVAQVTVSFQAFKAANAHPADAIRSE